MPLRAASKQSFPAVAVATTATVIGFINRTLGARYILVRSFNAGGNTNVTLSAAGSFNGVDIATGLGVVAAGIGRADGANSLLSILTFDAGSVSLPEPFIPVPFVRLSALIATTPANVSFEVWPLLDYTLLNQPFFPLATLDLP